MLLPLLLACVSPSPDFEVVAGEAHARRPWDDLGGTWRFDVVNTGGVDLMVVDARILGEGPLTSLPDDLEGRFLAPGEALLLDALLSDDPALWLPLGNHRSSVVLEARGGTGEEQVLLERRARVTFSLDCDLDRDGVLALACGGGDCDDRDRDAGPASEETCNYRDDDCDGAVDEDAWDAQTWYADPDGDGWGDPDHLLVSCQLPPGWTSRAGDCDDQDPQVYPRLWYQDQDQDGWGGLLSEERCAPLEGWTVQGEDCDDGDPLVHPEAAEVCDGDDQDCDGVVDEEGGDPAWYDADGDGWGDATRSVHVCAAPEGWVRQAGDCDDGDPSTHPLAPETDCDDPVDRNCDGSAGPVDGDADGWWACQECDDGEATAFPGAPEVCDGDDDDCDGLADEDDALDPLPWYPDADGDGFGVPGPVWACAPPPGHVAQGSDCDDGDPTVHPGAAETCGDDRVNACEATPAEVARSCRPEGEGTLAAAAVAYRIGENGGDYASDGLSGAGDQDGDGLDDLAVGAPGLDTPAPDAGGVYLLLAPLVGNDLLTVADVRLTSSEEGAFAGTALSGGRDVDGDGWPDLLVGARGSDQGGVDAGVAWLVRGPVTGDQVLEETALALVGPRPGDDAGGAVALLRDATGDGLADLLVGGRWADEAAPDGGVAWLVAGPATVTLASPTGRLLGDLPWGEAGFEVADGGDVDGDGLSDLLVGTPGVRAEAGGAALVLGPLEGDRLLSEADARWEGEAPYDACGRTVSGAGDIDGDGRDDLLLGAPHHSGVEDFEGVAWLLLGPATGTPSLSLAHASLEGEGRWDGAGWSVAGAGDRDGDGLHDIAVTAPWDDDLGVDGGTLYLLYGPVTGVASLADAPVRISHEGTDQVGSRVVGVGDLDGDLFPDLALGSIAFPAMGENTGAAWILPGGSF